MRTADPTTHKAWAIFLGQLWGSHFPVKVREVVLGYTKRFDDPVLEVKAAVLPSFEGALYPLQKRGGWAILYNPSIASHGRINYTQAHETGHFFAHRSRHPTGFRCGPSDALGVAVRADYRQQEREADEFASYLLMPLTDFRMQVAATPLGLDLLGHLSNRYGVSFTAAALKWLECTELCAAIVVANNGFVKWCRRSSVAASARIFYPFGMELPPASVAARGRRAQRSDGTLLAPGIWHRSAVREIAIFADQYEMTISLLVFESEPLSLDGWDDDDVEDAVVRFEQSLVARSRLET